MIVFRRVFSDDFAINEVRVTLNRKLFLRSVLAILVALNAGNAVAVYAMAVKGLDFGLGVVPLFNFDGEANLPTLFSGLLLIFGALLAFAISRWSAVRAAPLRREWFAVGLVLLFLGVDEMARIHEAVDFILMSRVSTDGAIAWPWVIPYGLLAIGVGLYFARFFFRLEWRYRLGLAIGGGLYVGSAIGFEMLGALYGPAEEGVITPLYGFLYTCEENGEMIGTIIAVYTLLRFLGERCEGFGATMRVVPANEEHGGA